MKKVLALICVFLLSISCSESESTPSVHFELLPVHSFEMPSFMIANETCEISISFLRPTVCHGFDGFLYEKNGFTRTIAVQSFVLEQSNCAEVDAEPATQILKFKPIEAGIYLFKFWKGKNADGEDIFEEVSMNVQ